MGIDEEFDLYERELYLRPWGKSRLRLAVAGLFHGISLTFVWNQMADAWHIASTVGSLGEIQDDWYF